MGREVGTLFAVPVGKAAAVGATLVAEEATAAPPVATDSVEVPAGVGAGAGAAVAAAALPELTVVGAVPAKTMVGPCPRALVAEGLIARSRAA